MSDDARYAGTEAAASALQEATLLVDNLLLRAGPSDRQDLEKVQASLIRAIVALQKDSPVADACARSGR